MRFGAFLYVTPVTDGVGEFDRIPVIVHKWLI